MRTRSRRHTLALGAAGAFLLAATAVPAASAAPPVRTADVAPVAQGKATFDCLLLPFQSAFRYEGNVSIAGPGDFEPGSTVEVVGRFPKLPGIAPVPIDGGKMQATAIVTLGGQDVELKATHTVNAEPKAEVPMPRLTGRVALADPGVSVELKRFSFIFDKMMGIVISADCEATDGANLGAMTSGDSDADSDADVSTQAATTEDEGMSAVVLGGGALAVVAAGALFWFSRRARRA